MLELERLIHKFWSNQTTLAENRRLIQLLEKYNEICKGAAQTGFPEKGADPIHRLPPEKALALLQNIHQNLGIGDPEERMEAKRASIRKLVRRMAVAASVCIIAGAAFLLANRHPAIKATAQGKATAQTIVPSLPRLIRKVNASDSPMTITLQDGSTVQLGKNSRLSYYEPFINQRRDISLSGLALFKVAKDKTKPFTVFAGGIATRVIGTRFWVNAADTAKVNVRLLEGKVAVNTMRGSGMTMNDVYLTPGQEFSFDKDSRHYVVNTIPDRPAHTTKPLLPDNRPELVFKKAPLGNVFKSVGDQYKVPLVFRKEELDGLYFTGTFLKSDDLNLVLSTICNVNDLHFSNQQDSIIITKQH